MQPPSATCPRRLLFFVNTFATASRAANFVRHQQTHLEPGTGCMLEELPGCSSRLSCPCFPTRLTRHGRSRPDVFAIPTLPTPLSTAFQSGTSFQSPAHWSQWPEAIPRDSPIGHRERYLGILTFLRIHHAMRLFPGSPAPSPPCWKGTSMTHFHLLPLSQIS